MAAKKSNLQASPYKVWLKPAVHDTRDQLPGYIRQQIKRIIDELKTAARPANSKVLVLPDSLISTAKAQRSQRKKSLRSPRLCGENSCFLFKLLTGEILTAEE
ncbi:MAG: hypothetical protein ACOYNY_41805 [Caldilineaceae bacterium]